MPYVARLYAPAERRRSDGESVDADTILRIDWNQPLVVVVHDISRHGFRGVCRAAPPPGSAVMLGLNGVGRADAIIRWQVDGRIGCEFDTPLTPAQIAGAVAGNIVIQGDFDVSCPAPPSGMSRLGKTLLARLSAIGSAYTATKAALVLLFA